MRRRDLILGLAGALGAARLARAQSPMPVIGYLHSQSPQTFAEEAGAFHQGLADEGFGDGRNLKIEYRWAYNDPAKLPELAADLVRRNVAVIGCGGGNITALAAMKATSTIPIVFDTGDDPVALGMVKSLARPGGNATGYYVVTAGLTGKRIGLLRELVPGGGTIAAIIVAERPATAAQLDDIHQAEKSVGQKFKIIDVKGPNDIATALSPAATAGAVSLLVGADPLLFGRRDEVVERAAKLRLPAIYEWSQYVEIGGLMSYGANIADAYRHVGDYVGKILKGAKPADLPVAEPTRYELAINLKTAKTLGITVPQILLAQAADLIE